jgi:FlaA1/EpsC-like NDP-sugar epimerase
MKIVFSFSKNFSGPTKQKFLFLISDIVLISLSVILAFIVRFEGPIPHRYFLNIKGLIFFSILFTIPIFYFFKLYFFSWAYVSAEELISLIKATVLSFLLLTATYFVLRDHRLFSGFPRSTLFITYFFIFILCGGLRFAKRIYFQIFPKGKREEKVNVLIVGAGDLGEQILRTIKSLPKSQYFPVGFVDDDLAKQGVLIHGLKVLGKIKDIPKIAKENLIEEMIIALPFGSKKIREAVELGRKAKIKKIKILPSIGDLISGEVPLARLKEIEVEDLLGREPIVLDKKLIADFLKGKIVLITGAAGSIGSELSKQIASFSPSLLLILDQDETGIFNLFNELREKFPKLKISSLICDIRDEEKVKKIFGEFKPEVVFHAAAYKHVPLMEENPDEAVKNNIFGTETIAKAALENGTEKFIFISTDKAVNPTSVMGATKRIGEMICQVLNKKGKTKFISVRFGNVLDSRGSVIPIFKQQIKSGGPVTVTHPEMKRYFMLNSEACLLVMEAGAIGKGGEVFVLDMGKPIKILDLAKEMIKLAGFEPDKEIPITFIGPRPGEKLFEEILTAEEGTFATKYQKILIAKLKEPEEEKLKKGLEELKTAIQKGEKNEIIKIFKGLIPSYSPQKNI